MCGVVAMFSTDSAVTAEPLVRAATALHHRGPDGQRVWVAPHRRVGLAHARLAIIDLVGGDQPIANEDETLRCVVNGEFYGFEQIREELVARGHRFRTRSDSEILLHLYEERGTACFEQLRGEFAFVLWDEANQTVFAGRDRFGIKPLYYTWHQGTLYLASEVKALFAAGVPARWDTESLFQACQLYLDPDRSMFEGVSQVPPGCFLFASRRQARVLRYWDFDFPLASQRPQGLDEAEQIERVRSALDEAVRIRLRADVPVAFYLSGGIDSCGILGTAMKSVSAPVDVFSISFREDASFDEEAAAVEMARHVGARFHCLKATDQQLADNFSAAVFHSELLPANENGVAKYLLSKMVHAQGIKVVLTGDGGDEIFAGYPHFRRDLLAADASLGADRKRELIAKLTQDNLASRGTLFPTGEGLPLTAVRSTLGFVPSWVEAFAGLGGRMKGLFDPAALGDLQHRDPCRTYLNATDVAGQLIGREPLDQARYLFTRTYLHNYMLVWLGDRAEMAHSVEGRTPLLDHHLVELVRELPPTMLVKGDVEKFAYREAVRPVVTQAAYARHKHPFTAPPGTLRPDGPLFTMAQDVLRSGLLDALPLFDARAVRRVLDQMHTFEARDRQVWGFPVMRLVGACLLQKHFGL